MNKKTDESISPSELVILATEVDSLLEKKEYDSIHEYIKDDWLVYLSVIIQLMQIHGVYIPSEHHIASDTSTSRKKRQGHVRFNEVEFIIEYKVYRFHANHSQNTMFCFKEGFLYFGRIRLDIKIHLISKSKNDRNSGYYFPNYPVDDDVSAIRFNPRNRGKCIGACVFCQRAYQIPKNSELSNRRDWSVNNT